MLGANVVVMKATGLNPREFDHPASPGGEIAVFIFVHGKGVLLGACQSLREVCRGASGCGKGLPLPLPCCDWGFL